LEVWPLPSEELINATIGTQLAQYYGENDNILFGFMNEPGGLNIVLWGITMQNVVDAVYGEIGYNDKILLV